MGAVVLEQQVFTRGKQGFATVAASEGISDEDKLSLERHSLYFVPDPILYKEGTPKPVKFVYYPLGSGKFVIGRAVYAGRDDVGRPGNYLFHNLVVPLDGFAQVGFNPARLTKELTSRGIFLDKAPDTERLDPVELDVTGAQVAPKGISVGDKKAILTLLYTCLNADLTRQPLLMSGSEEQVLDFLLWLFDVLPYNLRETISYDSQGYGMPPGYCIIGLPDQDDYRQSIKSSLALQLSDMDMTPGFEVSETPGELSFIVDLAASNRLDELNTLYFLQDCLQKGDYQSFKRGYDGASTSIKRFLFAFRKTEILDYVAASRDTDFLQLISDSLIIEDLHVIGSDVALLKVLAESGSKKTLELLADHLLAQAPSEDLYSLLFTSYELWQIFLNKLMPLSPGASVLVLIIGLLTRQYSADYEEALHYAMLPFLERFAKDMKSSSEIGRALAGLPILTPGIFEAGARVSQLNLLRTFAAYDLTRDTKCLDKLIAVDLSGFPAQYYAIMEREVLTGAFLTYRAEDVPSILKKLFSASSQKKIFLSALLRADIPRDVRYEVQETFSQLLASLPKDAESRGLASEAMQVFQAKSSLRDRLKGMFSS